ncbi:MAG TPA: DUF2169 domain-containing protein [Polyangia bacterium]|jgi:hypothetical protein|nr:DUF2169 domain-containing protein [Polyangia bacterium]
MRLLNKTGAAAYLYTVNLHEPELRAAVIVKRTYDLDRHGTLTPSPAALPLVPDQLITEFGTFHGEIFFRKRGVDFCVLGNILLNAPVTRLRPMIEIGAWRHELQVTGDRVWSRTRSGDLTPSPPVPFDEMPLGYTRAFGGVTEVGGEDVPWPDNPTGRGYYHTPEQALGKPLPNLESVAASGALAWNTRIPVAGWGPYSQTWGLRSARAITLDQQTGQMLDITPEIFNHAHPDLILDSVEAGAPVQVTGVRPWRVRFAVPTERPRVVVRLGKATSEAFGEVDGIFLWLDPARVVVTWRARFRYPVRAEEIRRAELSFV